MIVKNGLIFCRDRHFEAGDLYIEGMRIADRSLSETEEAVIDAQGLYVIPGLVDIHFHGAMGWDICDADEAGLQIIADYEAAHGILAICPATMTYSEEILAAVMDVASKHVNDHGADLVGINLEGPFISREKLGAQNPDYLMLPDADMIRRLQKRSGDLIKLVDIAPELDGSADFIRQMWTEVKISLAHTAADYDRALWALKNGASHMTHLFNAMPGINHREPGPIIAAMETGAEVELIADGIHVHPAMIRFTFRAFGPDKVILIADSMEATGLPDGLYALGGQKVRVQGNRACLAEDESVIAGSVTNLYDCMRYAHMTAGIPLADAVAAASINPARSIGIDGDYGLLEAGYLANVLLVDKELKIHHIIQKGKLIR